LLGPGAVEVKRARIVFSTRAALAKLSYGLSCAFSEYDVRCYNAEQGMMLPDFRHAA
jgi:hypothetical protein